MCKIRNYKLSMRPRINLEGKTFARLKVKKYLGRRSGQSEWLCECSCGGKKKVLYNHLTAGKTRSCGCLRKPHIL